PAGAALSCCAPPVLGAGLATAACRAHPARDPTASTMAIAGRALVTRFIADSDGSRGDGSGFAAAFRHATWLARSGFVQREPRRRPRRAAVPPRRDAAGPGLGTHAPYVSIGGFPA